MVGAGGNKKSEADFSGGGGDSGSRTANSNHQNVGSLTGPNANLIRSFPPSPTTRSNLISFMQKHVKYEHLLAGVSGGVASTLVLHPLDLLKVRLAVNDGQVATRPQYNGLWNAIKTIWTQEGVKGLYRGVTPNAWGAGTAWGFYFLFYNSIKAYMTGDNENAQLGPDKHMLAAAEAGVFTLVLTNPIWVVKTRLCLQYGGVNEQFQMPASKRYYGMIDTFRKVYKYEGLQGLYKGFVPGMLGVSHGALQFMAYEDLKRRYILRYNLRPDVKLTTLEYLSFAAISKLFAASITYPYQVLRARLQDQHNTYNGLIDVIRKTWRIEGFRGYYKGLLAYLLHVTPNICIVFLFYEKLSPSGSQAKEAARRRREEREARYLEEERQENRMSIEEMDDDEDD